MKASPPKWPVPAKKEPEPVLDKAKPFSSPSHMTPQDFLCPISKDRLEIPVIARDGFTYEVSAIKNWLSVKQSSPMMGTLLTSDALLPNKSLQYLLQYYDYCVTQQAHFCRARKHSFLPIIAPDLALRAKLNPLLTIYFQLTESILEIFKKMEALLIEFKKSFMAHTEYANMLRFNGDFVKAIEEAKEAKKIYKGCPIPSYMIVRNIASQNKEAEAKSILDGTLAKYALLDHTLLDTRYMTSAILCVKSKQKALDYINTYLSLVPKEMRAMLNRVYIYYSLNETKKVLDSSDEFLSLFDYDACVVYYRARAYTLSKDTLKAFESYDIIINKTKEPMFLAQCYYDKALLRNQDTQFADMIKEYKLAHKLYPKINADISLADAYRGKKNWRKAKKWMEKVGSRVDKDKNIFYLRLSGEINPYVGEGQQAVNSLLRLVEIDGRNSEYYKMRINQILDMMQAEGEDAAANSNKATGDAT